MTPAQELLSDAAKTVFRLNGQLLALAEDMARPVGLTAAWWQVLGVVHRDPLPVAEIARHVGVTRQSVQRIADVLVDRGLAEYIWNPAHRRAKLLRPTDSGRAAVRRIGPLHAELATRLSEELGLDSLRSTVHTLARLSSALDDISQISDDATTATKTA